MAICENCDGEDWDEIDGHFFCTTCQTQSQHMRVEEEENDVTASQSYSLLLTKKKSSKDPVEKKKKDKGRPWHTYEAFQFIIKEQVKVLISYGADPKLKDVVFKFWCNYLSKTGIAFPENTEKQKSLFGNYMRHREMYPPTLDNPIIPPVRSRKTWRKKYGQSIKKIEETNEKEDLAHDLLEEDFYEGDNPSQDIVESNEDSGSEVELEIECSKIQNKVEWMTLLRTLGFCYLGLLFLKSLVTASDIVRWVEQNQIPYLKVSTLLPDDMKFNQFDTRSFSQAKVPAVKDIYLETRKLVRFLNLPEPPSLTTSVLISKFIIKLNLPADLHGFAQQILTHLEKKDQHFEETRWIMPNYERTAMACIITTLLELHILDDCSEHEISQCGKELSQILNNDIISFCWEEWTSYVNKDMIPQKVFDDNLSECDIGQVKDTNQYINDLHIRAVETRSTPQELWSRRFNRSKTPETKEVIKRLTSKLQSQIEDEKCAAAETADFTDPHFSEDPVGYFQGEVNVDATDIVNDHDFSFRNHRLIYVTQSHSFIGKLGNIVPTNSSTLVDNPNGEDENAAYESEDLFDSSEEETYPKPKRLKLCAKNKMSSVAISRDTKLQCLSNTKLSEITERLVSIHSRFSPIKISGDLCFESYSFKWLLKLCSSVIKCRPESLYANVKKLQLLLFQSENDTKRNISSPYKC